MWFEEYVEIADEFCPYRELDGVDDNELTLEDVKATFKEWARMEQEESDKSLQDIGRKCREFIERW